MEYGFTDAEFINGFSYDKLRVKSEELRSEKKRDDIRNLFHHPWFEIYLYTWDEKLRQYIFIIKRQTAFPSKQKVKEILGDSAIYRSLDDVD